MLFRSPTIKKLFNAGYKDPLTIIELTEDELKKIDKLGNVAAKMLSKQFSELKKKGTNFAKYLTAMNYFQGMIAEKTCQKILNGLKLYTREEVDLFVLENYKKAFETDIEGVGTSTMSSFVKGIKKKWSLEKKDIIPITYYGLEEKSFDGKMTVVFTGFRNKDWERRLTEKGHIIGSSVSKKTTCLIVKEKGSGSTKERKAESLGIPIFTPIEFQHKFEF